MTLNLLEPQISPKLHKSLEPVISKALSRKKLFNYLSYMSNPQRSCLTKVIRLHFFGKSKEVSILEEIHQQEALLEVPTEVKQLEKIIISLLTKQTLPCISS